METLFVVWCVVGIRGVYSNIMEAVLVRSNLTSSSGTQPYLSPSKTTPLAMTLSSLLLTAVQLVGLGIGFLQLAHPATQAFTNTLQLWLVSTRVVAL